MDKTELNQVLENLPPRTDEQRAAEQELWSKLQSSMPELFLGPKLPTFPQKRGADFDEKFRAAIVKESGEDSIFLRLYNKYRELDLEQFSVTWGPAAVHLTQERRAEIMLEVLENPQEGEPLEFGDSTHPGEIVHL